MVGYTGACNHKSDGGISILGRLQSEEGICDVMKENVRSPIVFHVLVIKIDDVLVTLFTFDNVDLRFNRYCRQLFSSGKTSIRG